MGRTTKGPLIRLSSLVVSFSIAVNVPAQHFLSDDDRSGIIATIFEFQMATLVLKNEYGGMAICLEVQGKDPPSDILNRMYEVNPRSIAASRCTADASHSFVTETHRPAAFLRIVGIREVDIDTADIDIQKDAGELNGSGEVITLKRIQGRWIVGDSREHWVS